MASIEVRELSKVFFDEGRGEVRAVDGISFSCEAGQVFGLLGANGAGKTTTLRLLSTLLKPSSGSVSVMGYDTRDQAQSVRQSLGFHSASTALYPRLTARETIAFFAEINGYDRAAIGVRTEQLIERFGIGDYADTRVSKLSSGMKQKVSLARTVAHDPPVLIFDEPSVGLDIMNAIEMVEVISELRSEGKCILFSTHIMSEVEKLCDQIAIMQNGRILAQDSLDGHRKGTGHHYLEDIFVSYIRGISEATND